MLCFFFGSLPPAFTLNMSPEAHTIILFRLFFLVHFHQEKEFSAGVGSLYASDSPPTADSCSSIGTIRLSFDMRLYLVTNTVNRPHRLVLEKVENLSETQFDQLINVECNTCHELISRIQSSNLKKSFRLLYKNPTKLLTPLTFITAH